jgi:hypothetical protein
MIGGRMLRRGLVVFFALGLAALVAGCGKAVPKDEYQRAAAEPLGQVDAALRLVENATPEGLGAAAEDARPMLIAAAQSLDEVGAPKGLSEAHALLVEGIGELADDIADVAGASASQDIPEALEAIEAMPALDKLQRAQELFAREGVTLVVGPAPLPLPETGGAETGAAETSSAG